MGAIAVILAYLGGSISFPYWVARFRGVDLRAVGSRKLGGSNLWKSVGRPEAVVGGLLDAAKGLAAVLIARSLGFPLQIQLACGLPPVVGQLWPLLPPPARGAGNPPRRSLAPPAERGAR